MTRLYVCEKRNKITLRSLWEFAVNVGRCCQKFNPLIHYQALTSMNTRDGELTSRTKNPISFWKKKKNLTVKSSPNLYLHSFPS